MLVAPWRQASVPDVRLGRLIRTIKSGEKDNRSHGYHNHAAGVCGQLFSCSTTCDFASDMTGLPAVADVVVVGGGIAGLAAARYLATSLPPSARIVVLEASSRPGGWIHSQRIALPPAPGSSTRPTALVESGPRSLRPRGATALAMLDLVDQLGLWERMLRVPTSAPSARKRFIWSGGRVNLLPSGLLNLYRVFTAPVLRNSWTDALWDLVTPARPSAQPRPRSESVSEASRIRLRYRLMQDESVHSFLTRRFGGRTHLADNIVSAAVHGIWAGDTRSLSIRSLMPSLWEREQSHGRLVFGRRRRALSVKEMTEEEIKIEHSRSVDAFNATVDRTLLEARLGDGRLAQLAKTSIYSFPEGLGEITDALVRQLSALPNVTLTTGNRCDRLEAQENCVKVSSSQGTIETQRIIAALPSRDLQPLLTPQLPASLLVEPAATVGVVNVVVPAWVAHQVRPGRKLLDVEGFGVLIPRSEEPENPDKVLGVVIDSDALPTQDEERHVKLTVMLGGAYWAGKHESELPSLSQLEEAGKRAVQKIVGLPKDALGHPATVVQAALARDCIPWYTVGHTYRLAQLHQHLALPVVDGGWEGRLALVGASYLGVSLNDCVFHARRVALAIAHHKPTTGLEPIALETGLAVECPPRA